MDAVQYQRDTMMSHLATIANGLGAIEVEVLTFIAERLAKGERTYGPFQAKDSRDFAHEALEEIADGLVYAGRAAVQLKARQPKAR